MPCVVNDFTSISACLTAVFTCELWNGICVTNEKQTQFSETLFATKHASFVKNHLLKRKTSTYLLRTRCLRKNTFFWEKLILCKETLIILENLTFENRYQIIFIFQYHISSTFCLFVFLRLAWNLWHRKTNKQVRTKALRRKLVQQKKTTPMKTWSIAY